MTNKTIAAPIAHVEFHPIFDVGDHCVISSLSNAEYFGAYVEPAGRDEVFDEASETLDHIFENAAYAGARRWYNGNEICAEITCADDVFNILNDIYCVSPEDCFESGEELGFDATKIAALVEKAKRS